MRPKRRAALMAVLTLPALLPVGCATRPPPPPVASHATRPGPTGPRSTDEIADATVMVVRPISRSELDGVAAERSRLLHAIGLRLLPENAPLVELIVHEDTGRTIAVVQPPLDGMAPGARVVVRKGEPVRLPRTVAAIKATPPPPPAPAVEALSLHPSGTS